MNRLTSPLKVAVAFALASMRSTRNSVALRAGCVAAIASIAILMPRAATAQDVSASISATPNPYHSDDVISLDVEGDWDSETVDWPCDMFWEDGGCAPSQHTFYVYGSDDFFESWSDEDDLQSTGWDSAGFDDTNSLDGTDSITYTVDLAVEYCDMFYSDCWDVATEAEDTASPSNAVSVLCTPDDIYNFDGYSVPAVATQTICTSSAGGATEWTVDSSLTFQSYDVGQVSVWANQGVGSSGYFDLFVTASDGYTSDTAWITVRRPNSGSLYGDYAACVDPAADWGWFTHETWSVWDQLGDGLQYGVQFPASERFGPRTIDWYDPDQMRGWEMPTPNGAGPPVTDYSGHIHDYIRYSGPDQDPSIPATDCNTQTAQVDHWTQTWSLAGIDVILDTIVRTLGRGFANQQ